MINPQEILSVIASAVVAIVPVILRQWVNASKQQQRRDQLLSATRGAYYVEAANGGSDIGDKIGAIVAAASAELDGDGFEITQQERERAAAIAMSLHHNPKFPDLVKAAAPIAEEVKAPAKKKASKK